MKDGENPSQGTHKKKAKPPQEEETQTQEVEPRVPAPPPAPLDPNAGRVESRMASLENTVAKLNKTIERLLIGKTPEPADQPGKQPAESGGFFSGGVTDFFGEKESATPGD